MKCVGEKFGFSGLDESIDGSLATERPVFLWLKEEIRRDYNPPKASFTIPFGNNVSVA